jgi:hypothetical protein
MAAPHPRSFPTRIGHRVPEQSGWIRNVWHDHGLSIVLLTLFVCSMVGQAWAGWRVYNEEQQAHGEERVSFASYLRTGHFGEATFENWESEFLQMAFFIVLTAFLYQKGSSESKRPDVVELVDLDPREWPAKASAPWPVRRGGWMLAVYENSLSLAFGLLFVFSFAMHLATGLVEYNNERLAHGLAPLTAWGYLRSGQFWFESLQNWQSEFLSLVAMVVFTIFLRQRGSPESKPVAAGTWDTGS